MCMNVENVAKYATVQIKDEVASLYGDVRYYNRIGEAVPSYLKSSLDAYEKELAERGELAR